MLWESNPFCVPEELDDLLFDEEDYRETGAAQSDIITAKASTDPSLPPSLPPLRLTR